MTDDLLERARAYRPYNMLNDGPLVADLAAEISRLRQRVVALEGALEPFAAAAKVNDSDTLSMLDSDARVVFVATGSWSGGAAITLGDLRRAFNALATIRAQEG